MPGVVAVLTGADLLDIDPYWGHAIKDRPIVAIDRVRFAGEPVAAVAAVDEATAEAAVRDDRGRVRGAARRGHARRGARAGCAAGPRRAPPAGPVPRPGHAARARRQHLLPLRASTGAMWTPRSPARRHRGRGGLHLPGRLPVRDGDAQRHRPVWTRTGSRCGRPASTRSWSGPRSPRCSTCPWARCASSCPTSAAASAASPTPRWSPSRWPSRARRDGP